ncbi:MAG TPA: hypothetical protein VLM87_14220 [Rubrivivax sp.]|nr:hypothetical protein [Rubrivivax sp.]
MRPNLPSDPAPTAGTDAEPLGRWGLTRRERLWGIAILLAALLLLVALIVAMWQPAPPRRVVMSTGAEDGVYHAFGQRYRQILARSGVELLLLPSAGAVENLERRKVVERLVAGLHMSGPGVPPLVPLSGLQAAAALERGEVDVAMLVSAPEGAAVQRLLRAPGIELWSWRRADAYVRQYPGVSRLDIPEGGFDLLGNLPQRDTTLLALKTSLVARADIHPVLVDLLLDAAREVHGGNGLLQRAGEFPSAETYEYRMSADAERNFTSGPSALRQYLPYWSVVWIQRLVFFGLPLLAVGVPLLRVAPVPYRWAIRRRIYRWYGELSFIERAVGTGRDQRDPQLRRLNDIEERVNRLRIPASFAGEAYTLRSHVKMVRERLSTRPTETAS